MPVKSIVEFKHFYLGTLTTVLGSLEAERKAAIGMVGGIILSLLATVLPIILFNKYLPETHESGLFLLGGIPGFVFTIIYTIRYSNIYSSLKKKFKHEVIGSIVRFLDDGLNYEPKSHIDKTTFHSSKIFLQSIARYRGDDLVYGKTGLTTIQFSEIHAESRTQDSKGRSSYHTIFKGIFFVSDFHKSFQSETIVLPDTAEKIFGWLGKTFQKMNFTRPQLVNLEDPEFEKEFVVYGTDQVESRYILSTSLASRILDFKEKTGKKVSISFIGNNMFLALPYSKPLFEFGLFTSFFNEEKIFKYFHDLQLLIGIVDELNLNTRIWSRE